MGNVAPSLFKDGEASGQRLRRYLAGEETDVTVSERAGTVDIVRYLLSYIYGSSDICSEDKELTDLAVRNIMVELVSFSALSQSSTSVELTPNQICSSQHEQFSRPPGQNIEMKRGDWICTRCSFMNFARNVRCLECNEQRPKKMLTGGEWECPQCDFYNYGRNMSCLKCDCKRPATIPPHPTSVGADLGGVVQQLLKVTTSVGKSEIERKLAENDEKAERWLSKVSQLHDSADLSSLAEDEDFPEIMPMRKGVNKFVVSTRKTPLERRLANAQYSSNNILTLSDPKISQTLDRILGSSAPTAAPNNQSVTSDATMEAPKKSIDHLSGIDPVPFEPLSADLFAKPESNDRQRNENEKNNVEDGSSMANNTVPLPERRSMESLDTAEKWSEKVAELDNVKDSPSAISDENFPEIMPIRKGENRFVVSKKKDRSLTSQQYKRRSILEQADSSDFVPFVPFPPGYFGKKDTPIESTTHTGIMSGDGQPKGNLNNENWNRNYYQYQSQSQEFRPSGNAYTGSGNTGNSEGNINGSRGESTYHEANFEKRSYYNSGYSNNGYWSSDNNNSNNAWSDNSNYNNNNAWSGNNSYNGCIRNDNTSCNSNRDYNYNDTWSASSNSAWSSSNNNNQSGPFADNSNATRSSSSVNANHSVHSSGYGGNSNRGYTGKSLEGSAVKDPDPLDMSEEAKAERWFRRAAQIKDISELANIPDEDFPEIMPMRKGVNRFVVSKRKTPLERRLTSPQYRRNLPIVSSETDKDAN